MTAVRTSVDVDAKHAAPSPSPSPSPSLNPRPSGPDHWPYASHFHPGKYPRPPVDQPSSRRQLTRSTSGLHLFTSRSGPVHQWTAPFHVFNWPVHQWTTAFHLVDGPSPLVDNPFCTRELGQSTSGLCLLTSLKGSVHQWTVPFHLVKRVSPLVDQLFSGVK